MQKTNEEIVKSILEAQGVTSEPKPAALKILADALEAKCVGNICFPDANATYDA
jgi:ribosomal protein L12E/L44/L45/RPP1/RPP2